MIHILCPGITKASDSQQVVAFYDALQDANCQTGIHIEVFDKCKQDIYKWSGDTIFIVNSNDSLELAQMISHICVLRRVNLYFVNTDLSFNFRAISLSLCKLLEQKQSKDFRVTLLVPATVRIKDYAKRIADFNVNTVHINLHSLINYETKTFVQYQNSCKGIHLYCEEYDSTLNRFGIVKSSIEPFVKQGCLPVFRMNTYCKAFAALHLINLPKQLTNEDVLSIYNEHPDVRFAALNNIKTALEQARKHFLIELKRLCTINLQ